MRKKVLAVIAVLSTLLAFQAASPQEQPERKVIKKTVDERGFEKQLTEVDLMYQTAKQYISAGLLDKAATELEKVVVADSTRREAWLDLSMTYGKLKRYDKAAAALEQAKRQWPEDIYILSSLGFAQVNAGMMEQAVNTYLEMLHLDSLSYDANVHLAFIYQKQGDKKKAVRHYEKALLSKGDDVQTLGSLAKLYGDLGEQEKAVETYEKAVAVAPNNDVLKTKLGAAYISAGKFEKSAALFEQLVAKNPENPTYRINLGISYAQLKRPKDAIAAIERATELKPDAGVAYLHLANLYNEIGKYQKAIQAAKKGLEYYPKKAPLYCAWGKSLEKLKRYDEAISKFKQAVDDPQWGDYARKQIERQKKLKIREQKIRERSLE